MSAAKGREPEMKVKEEEEGMAAIEEAAGS